MQIFLIRHAEAVEETLALRDPHRHLSDAGRAQARALGDRLRWHDCVPTEVWTSPLVRAVQTTELVLTGLGLGDGVSVISAPALAPGGDARVIGDRLRELDGSAAVLVVGHEPTLSGLGVSLSLPELGVLARAEAVRIDGTVEGLRVRWRFAWSDSAPRPVPPRA
ncbi:MAG: histidine phosphatase family protein [Kofleriaceae bacterium]